MTFKRIKSRYRARYKTPYVTFRQGKDVLFSRGLISKALCKHGDYYEVSFDEAKRTVRLRPLDVEPGPDNFYMVVRLTSPNHLQFTCAKLFDTLNISTRTVHRPAKIDGGVIEFGYPYRQRRIKQSAILEGKTIFGEICNLCPDENQTLAFPRRPAMTDKLQCPNCKSPNTSFTQPIYHCLDCGQTWTYDGEGDVQFPCPHGRISYKICPHCNNQWGANGGPR